MAYAAVIGFMNNMNRLKDPDIYPEGNEAYLALRRDRTIDELVPLEKNLQEFDTKNDQRFDAAAINGVDAEIRKAVWRVHHSLRPSNCEDACNHRKHMENEISHFHRTATMLEEKFKTLLSNPLPEEDEVEEGDVSPIPSKPAAAILLSDLFDKILSMILDSD